MSPEKLIELRNRYRKAFALSPKAAQRAEVDRKRHNARLALEKALLAEYPKHAATPDGPSLKCSRCNQYVKVFAARTWHFPPHLQGKDARWCKGGANPENGESDASSLRYLSQSGNDTSSIRTISAGLPTLGKRR